MTTTNDAAKSLQGEALPAAGDEVLPDELPKVGGSYNRLPNGRIVPREPVVEAIEITTPTAVPAADPETVQED